MPTEPVAQVLLAFEAGLLLTGGWLLFRLIFQPAFRARWLTASRLPAWNIAPAEFGLYLLVMFAGGFLVPAVLRTWLGVTVANSPDRAGLEVLVYGGGLDLGGIAGWLLFPLLRRGWHSDYGVAVPLEEPRAEAPPPLGPALRYGGGVVALALPVLAGVSIPWTAFLRVLGLPADPQDSIGIFTSTESPLVVAGMLVVACVVAPIMEELLFRAGIYRFCRKHLGRVPAVILSGILFGAIHVNWAGFLPLALLGMLLAVVYESTGSIRVAIVAHGFFNLNTILVVLSGLTL